MFLSWWEVRKNEILCFWVGGKLRKTKYYVSELVGGQEKRNITFLSWREVREIEKMNNCSDSKTRFFRF
jgi:hypothetical protein